MIEYTEHLVDSSKKLLNLISELGKAAWYKVNIQKSKTFLYTNNEITETEIRKKIPFAIATRKIKWLGIKLTKEVKDLYSENYTTLKKEIKEVTNKWKHVPCSWIGRINIIQISILHKAFYRFDTIPVKIPMMALTGVVQRAECWTANQRVAGSIPSLDTCLRCGPHPQLEAFKRQPSSCTSMFLSSLCPYLLLSLKLSGIFKKNYLKKFQWHISQI